MKILESFNQTDPSNEKNEKIEKILQGGMLEFLRSGYAGTSMDRVAQAAGVSKSTVYSYFQDKQSLFAALVKQMSCVRLQSVFDSHPLQGDPRSVLRELAQLAVKEMKDDHAHTNFVRLIIGESGRFPELAKIFVENLPKVAISNVANYLKGYCESKGLDPHATARVYVGSLIYFIMLQYMLQGEEIIPLDSNLMIDNLINVIFGVG